MKKSLKGILLVAAAALLVAGGYEIYRAGFSGAAMADESAKQALIALHLPDVDNAEQPLTQWLGRVMVINFWATWCTPCKKEIPAFSAVSRKYAEQPVQFVGISIDSPENVKRFRQEFDVPYPLLIGSAQTLGISSQLGNSARALPFTVILNRRGDIDHVQLGMLTEKQLNDKIQTLLKD